MTPLILSLFLAGAPDALAEKAIEAVGGREVLAKQNNVSVHTIAGQHEEVVIIDVDNGGVRVEERVDRRAQRVRARLGNHAWDFQLGAIPLGELDLPPRIWLPARLFLDETAQRERVVGAPRGQQRVLFTLSDGQMVYVDIKRSTGRVARLEGLEGAQSVVVKYDEWRKYDGDQWLPQKLSVTRGGKTEKQVVKYARFNSSMAPVFFASPYTGRDL